METTNKQPWSPFGPVEWEPIDFNKDYSKSDREKKRRNRISKTTALIMERKRKKEETLEEIKAKAKKRILPRQLLINLLENREYFAFKITSDNYFWIAEILHAEEFAVKSLMEDLILDPKNNVFHYHISPQNNRFKIYIEKDLYYEED